MRTSIILYGAILLILSGCASNPKTNATGTITNQIKTTIQTTPPPVTTTADSIKVNTPKASSVNSSTTPSQPVRAVNKPVSTPTNVKQVSSVTSIPQIVYPIDKQEVWGNNTLVIGASGLTFVWKGVTSASSYTIEVKSVNGNITNYTASGNSTRYAIPIGQVPLGYTTVRVAANLNANQIWSQPVTVNSCDRDRWLFWISIPFPPYNTPPIPKQDIPISFKPFSMPLDHYRITLTDVTNNPNFTRPLDNWVGGKIETYVIPGSLLKSGHSYELNIYGTNTTNRFDPNYVEFRPDNAPSGWDAYFTVK